MKEYFTQIDKLLKDKSYFVGDKITLADVYVAVSMNLLMATLIDEEYRKELPNLTTWYERIRNKTNSLTKMSFNALNIKVWFGKMKLCFNNVKVNTYYYRKTYITWKQYGFCTSSFMSRRLNSFFSSNISIKSVSNSSVRNFILIFIYTGKTECAFDF